MLHLDQVLIQQRFQLDIRAKKIAWKAAADVPLGDERQTAQFLEGEPGTSPGRRIAGTPVQRHLAQPAGQSIAQPVRQGSFANQFLCR